MSMFLHFSCPEKFMNGDTNSPIRNSNPDNIGPLEFYKASEVKEGEVIDEKVRDDGNEWGGIRFSYIRSVFIFETKWHLDNFRVMGVKKVETDKKLQRK